MPVVIRWLAYSLLALTLVPLGLAVREFTKARLAAYYAIRRSALARGSRYLAAAVVPPIVGVLLLILPAQVARVLGPSPTPSLLPTSTPTQPPQPTSTPVPTATPTRRPTATPPSIATATPTRRPTATAPPIPSPTTTVLPPDFVMTPIPSELPARPEARIELLALASELNSSGEPVDPGKEFLPGQHLVHLFFRYKGMDASVPVAVAWYKDGQLWDICTGAWLWDLVEGRVWGEAGTASVSCQPITGWQLGSYEIRVYIGTKLQGIAQFVVK